MENKYIKDFVITIAVLLLLAFGMRNYYTYQQVDQIPNESEYKSLALGETLLNQIQDIELSIKDRKSFQFTVTIDPLEQNLIVKTMQDLEKQWREEVEKLIRLESTVIPAEGDKLASIAHQGESKMYKVGESFMGRKIEKISSGKIEYTYRGTTGFLQVTELPPKPEAISNSSKKQNHVPNW